MRTTSSKPVSPITAAKASCRRRSTQARYIINENFSVFVEGVNIFGEDVGRHGRFSNQFLGVVDTGARYSAGVRAEF